MRILAKKVRLPFILSLCLCLMFTLSACGKTTDDTSALAPTENTQSTGNVTEQSETSNTEKIDNPVSENADATEASPVSGETEEYSSVLVIYFSHTGTTKGVSEYLHELVGGDLIEIETVNPYPEGYSDALDPAKQEQRENARPEIANEIEHFDSYESGSVLLVTTNDGDMDNVMTISWQMVMDFSPHIAITTGGWNESFETILKTKECCICVPAFDMVETVVGVGTVHGSDYDKFSAFGLDRAKAKKVKAPVISNCLAAIECKLEDYIERHGILVFKGVQLWENLDKEERRVIHANGDGTFFADGEFVNLRDKMRQWVPEGSERF